MVQFLSWLFHGTHGVTGFVAVTLFILALLALKFKRLDVHRKIGRIFEWMVLALLLVSFGFLMSRPSDSQLGSPVARIFFTFQIFQCGTAAWHARRALLRKNHQGFDLSLQNLLLPIICLTYSVYLFNFGWRLWNWAIIGSATIGIVGSSNKIIYWIRGPRGPRAWLFEHANGMMGAGLLLTSAVIVTALPYYGLYAYSFTDPVRWLGPYVVGKLILRIWFWRTHSARDFSEEILKTESKAAQSAA